MRGYAQGFPQFVHRFSGVMHRGGFCRGRVTHGGSPRGKTAGHSGSGRGGKIVKVRGPG